MFIVYADHIIHQARVTSVIERVGDDTLAMIVDQYPRSNAANEITGELPDRVPDLVVRAPRKGHILEIDVAALLDAVAEREVVVAMIPAIGDFIPSDGRLFELYGDADVDPARLAGTVDIDAERSITQDVPFGFRLLVDIAERALSSGVNDPTTATQALDRLHDLLRQLGTRPFPTGWHADEHGEPRLFVAQPTWELFVALAFEEIRHYGRDSLQVARRSRAALLDLVDELPDDRHAALHRQLRLLDDMVEAGFDSDLERQAARFPDAQGIGSGQGFDATDDAWDASPP
jgi:uncharacterized membrane protein